MDANTQPTTAAHMIQRRRAELGISQEDAADRANIARRTWGQIERGSRKGNVKTLAKMDKVLDMPPGSLAALDAPQPVDPGLAEMKREVVAMIGRLTSREEVEAVWADLTRRRLKAVEAALDARNGHDSAHPPAH